MRKGQQVLFHSTYQRRPEKSDEVGLNIMAVRRFLFLEMEALSRWGKKKKERKEEVAEPRLGLANQWSSQKSRVVKIICNPHIHIPFHKIPRKFLSFTSSSFFVC